DPNQWQSDSSVRGDANLLFLKFLNFRNRNSNHIARSNRKVARRIRISRPPEFYHVMLIAGRTPTGGGCRHVGRRVYSITLRSASSYRSGQKAATDEQPDSPTHSSRLKDPSQVEIPHHPAPLR